MNLITSESWIGFQKIFQFSIAPFDAIPPIALKDVNLLFSSCFYPMLDVGLPNYIPFRMIHSGSANWSCFRSSAVDLFHLFQRSSVLLAPLYRCYSFDDTNYSCFLSNPLIRHSISDRYSTALYAALYLFSVRFVNVNVSAREPRKNTMNPTLGI